MKDVLEAAGIEVTSSNKKEIDKALHKIMGVGYKNCSSTWKKLKQELAKDDKKTAKLIQGLKKALVE
jgi:hypothetical protein